MRGNAKGNAAILDYIMTSYPCSLESIATPSYTKVQSIKPSYIVENRVYYASDHNALIMRYEIPKETK